MTPGEVDWSIKIELHFLFVFMVFFIALKSLVSSMISSISTSLIFHLVNNVLFIGKFWQK